MKQETVELHQLAIRCLAHLEQEEALLAETLETMQAVRQRLLRRDAQGLEQLLQQQDRTADAARELASRRNQLRQQIGQQLAMPAERVSLSTLAKHLEPKLQQRLLTFQHRLGKMVSQVELLHRGNAVLIGHSIEMLQQLLQRLTGTPTADARYGASGQVEPTPPQSVFQAEW